MEFLTIYCFVFLLKMKPWGSFQVDEATNSASILKEISFWKEILKKFRKIKGKKFWGKSEGNF